MILPTKTVVFPDWQVVCDELEKCKPFGLYLEPCSPDATRALYIWAKKNRGYRISYRVKPDNGVFITIKDKQ